MGADGADVFQNGSAAVMVLHQEQLIAFALIWRPLVAHEALLFRDPAVAFFAALFAARVNQVLVVKGAQYLPCRQPPTRTHCTAGTHSTKGAHHRCGTTSINGTKERLEHKPPCINLHDRVLVARGAPWLPGREINLNAHLHEASAHCNADESTKGTFYLLLGRGALRPGTQRAARRTHCHPHLPTPMSPASVETGKGKAHRILVEAVALGPHPRAQRSD